MPDGPMVRRMFASVAHRYDLANRILSLGIDSLWRRAAIRAAGDDRTGRVLDLCAGTGDLTFAFARAGARVIGIDFCPEMLVLTRGKHRRMRSRPRFLAGDALALPFGDHSFDLVSVAFGIRNVADPVASLLEMRRVVRPGGRALVLEFAQPARQGLGRPFWFYFRHVLPRLGRWITGDRTGAYSYLPASVMTFPDRDAFLALMRAAGWRDASYQLLTSGVAALYCAQAPH